MTSDASDLFACSLCIISMSCVQRAHRCSISLLCRGRWCNALGRSDGDDDGGGGSCGIGFDDDKDFDLMLLVILVLNVLT